jgi:hypothetical protein
MRHASRLGVLMFTMALAGSGRAEAGGLWDWLEELNGPGPSKGWNFMFNVKCTGNLTEEVDGKVTTKKLDTGIFQLPEKARSNARCLFMDFRSLKADDDERFYPVNVKTLEFGPSAWVHPALEIGAGFGRMWFSSTNTSTGQEFHSGNWTISFPRVMFKPLLALPFKTFEDARWGILQMYFKETIVVGTLSQDDFASKPDTSFERSHQRVESMGFIVDVTPLADQLITKVLKLR